jgi:hypothetical protein
MEKVKPDFWIWLIDRAVDAAFDRLHRAAGVRAA